MPAPFHGARVRTASVAIWVAILLTTATHQPLYAAEPADAVPTVANQTGETLDGTSPVSRCADLCGKLYGSEAANRKLCEEGCAEAERCTNRCSEQFSDDGDKLARCNYLCARAR